MATRVEFLIVKFAMDFCRFLLFSAGRRIPRGCPIFSIIDKSQSISYKQCYVFNVMYLNVMYLRYTMLTIANDGKDGVTQFSHP